MPRKSVPADQARKEGKPMAAITEKDFSHIILRDREGNKYTLEFNARVVKNMERNGFKIDTDYPMTMVEKLFTGAFQMHHKGMMPERIMDIWKYQSKKEDLLGALVKLYLKPVEDLMGEEESAEGGKNEDPTWETD